MKKRCVLLVVLMVVVAGCNSYYKPGATLDQAVRDCQECDYEANKATSGQSSAAYAGYLGANLVAQCMQLRGYRLCPQSSLPDGTRKANVGFVSVAGK